MINPSKKLDEAQNVENENPKTVLLQHTARKQAIAKHMSSERI